MGNIIALSAAKGAFGSVSNGLNNKKFHEIFLNTGFGKQYCKYLEDGVRELKSKEVIIGPESLLCQDIFDWLWSMDEKTKTAIMNIPLNSEVDEGLKFLGINSSTPQYCNDHIQICLIGKIISYGMANETELPPTMLVKGANENITGAGSMILSMKLINILLLIIVILLIYILIINSKFCRPIEKITNDEMEILRNQNIGMLQ